MAVMHDLDWLFAIGTIFFCLSVWGIGANVSRQKKIFTTLLCWRPRNMRLYDVDGRVILMPPAGYCQLVRDVSQLPDSDAHPSWYAGNYNRICWCYCSGSGCH